MGQFRKDAFSPGWVLILPERGLEASDFGKAVSSEATCALCQGREGEAGPEIRALRPTASPVGAPDWRMRVIAHPQASLQADKRFHLHQDGSFTSAPSYGYQEVIVEHAEHKMRLEDMRLEHVVELFKLYRERLALLGEKPDVKHVQLTRNVGAGAGAMFEHPHAQVLAVPVENRWLAEERHAAQQHYQQAGRCLFCEIVSLEQVKRERLVTHNHAFVALTPYASKTPFETWILPTAHHAAFSGLASNHLADLAGLVQDVLRAMNRALDYPPYNMILHTLPYDEASYHWHLELLPRLTRQAGFDWSSGFYINPTPPEDAARFLREALALQGVDI